MSPSIPTQAACRTWPDGRSNEGAELAASAPQFTSPSPAFCPVCNRASVNFPVTFPAVGFIWNSLIISLRLLMTCSSLSSPLAACPFAYWQPEIEVASLARFKHSWVGSGDATVNRRPTASGRLEWAEMPHDSAEICVRPTSTKPPSQSCAARCPCPAWARQERRRCKHLQAGYLRRLIDCFKDVSTPPISRASFSPFPPSEDRLPGSLAWGDVVLMPACRGSSHFDGGSRPCDSNRCRIVLNALAWMRQQPARARLRKGILLSPPPKSLPRTTAFHRASCAPTARSCPQSLLEALRLTVPK